MPDVLLTCLLLLILILPLPRGPVETDTLMGYPEGDPTIW